VAETNKLFQNTWRERHFSELKMQLTRNAKDKKKPLANLHVSFCQESSTEKSTETGIGNLRVSICSFTFPAK